MEHFHPYLYGRRLLLQTDHASLTWLLNLKIMEAKYLCRFKDYRSMTWKFATEKGQHMEMPTHFREDPVLKAANTSRESKGNLA
ncbi:hypothetical protein TNCV_1208891 [Trichonephila clavipes]|nr:hypothetical protein TNCV_1208891 [Trichonephila clavipes]